MKKKHQPGCPCCVIPNPCGCDSTQLRIELTRVDNTATIYSLRFIPGPCNEVTFEGFSALEGEYYVDWPQEGPYPISLVLAEMAATNNPQYDDTGVVWCLYCRIILTVISPCLGELSLHLSPKEYLVDDFVSCSTVQDHDWVNEVSFNSEHPAMGIELCVSGDGRGEILTTQDMGSMDPCPQQVFIWEAECNPVF